MYHSTVNLATSLNGVHQTVYLQTISSGHDQLVNTQFCQVASLACEICANPVSLDSLVFGFRCCRNCYDFMLKSPGNRRHECAFAWNCPIIWNPSESWPRCEACCWKKITERSNLRHDPSIAQLAPRSTARPTTSQVIRQRHSTPAVTTDLTNRPSRLLICEICNRSTVIRFRAFGPDCCGSCYRFAKISRSEGIFYKCLLAGQCSLKWEPNKSLCSACRMKKIIEHPKFFLKDKQSAGSQNYQATTSSSSSGLTYQQPSLSSESAACKICERPNPVVDKPYGIFCCAHCVRFIAKIISEKQPPKECRLSTNKCEVNWLSSNHVEPCASCKWRKIESHPDFTHRHLMSLPVHSLDPPVIELESTDDALEVLCSICDSTLDVSTSKYGVYCKECLSFINKTIDRETTTESFHNGDGLIMWKAKKKRWFIMCKAKDLRKMGEVTLVDSHPSTKINTASPTVEMNDDAHVSNVPAAEKKKNLCEICMNPSFVSLSQRYGLTICNSCYRFLRRTKKEKLAYECEDNGNCDISWAPNKELCDSCLLDRILKHPDFLIESMS